MAARVLLQRVSTDVDAAAGAMEANLGSQRSLAPLATLALGGMALVPATVLAEAPTDKVCAPPETAWAGA